MYVCVCLGELLLLFSGNSGSCLSLQTSRCLSETAQFSEQGGAHYSVSLELSACRSVSRISHATLYSFFLSSASASQDEFLKLLLSSKDIHTTEPICLASVASTSMGLMFTLHTKSPSHFHGNRAATLTIPSQHV